LNDLNAQTTKERQGKIIGVGRSSFRRFSNSRPAAVVYLHLFRSPSFAVVRLRSSSFSPSRTPKENWREKEKSLSHQYHSSEIIIFLFFDAVTFHLEGRRLAATRRSDLTSPFRKQKQKKTKKK
jgi:hypothetical protein